MVVCQKMEASNDNFCEEAKETKLLKIIIKEQEKYANLEKNYKLLQDNNQLLQENNRYLQEKLKRLKRSQKGEFMLSNKISQEITTAR